MNRVSYSAIGRATSSRSTRNFSLPKSRLILRSLHSTPRYQAGTDAEKSAYAKKMQDLLNPKTTKSKYTIPLQQPWPWHEIVSTSPNTITLQRTLFARPPDLSPPLLLFAAGIWGLFVIAYIALPDVPKKEYTADEKKIIEENKRKQEEANILSRLSMSFTSAIFSSAQPLIYGIVTVALLGLIASSTRIVTRINMVQIKPKNSEQAGKTSLKLTNVGHEMIPWGSRGSRELKVEDCQVYIPNLKNSHTIRLKVLKDGQPSKWSLDRFPYSLDYRPVPDNARLDKEVVQSTNRLQHVFGTVRAAE
ncbi:uncharacterized protein I206_103546 [Kwoniella pini CBS 10737]|uniref:Uncharacterized protein n=1 Tax=Kwoniella pini CBS 10737 TaxID=1296096 RepID=A0A1B9I9F0_9TREE|nr:uncharacterized protein I206_01450 [Kwoniella pini CBS 10737]OCF52165.1 hypothetical protein I206_01450 [Kwoniella pini CBS 10737]